MARAHRNPRGRKHCAESLLTLWHNILRRHTRPQGELPAQRRCGKSSDAEPAGERFASVCLEKCSSAAVLHFSRRSGDHLEHLHFQLSHNPLGWPASQPMTYFKTRTSGSPVSTSVRVFRLTFPDAVPHGHPALPDCTGFVPQRSRIPNPTNAQDAGKMLYICINPSMHLSTLNCSYISLTSNTV